MHEINAEFGEKCIFSVQKLAKNALIECIFEYCGLANDRYFNRIGYRH